MARKKVIKEEEKEEVVLEGFSTEKPGYDPDLPLKKQREFI